MKVPTDSLVCEVGGSEWRRIDHVAPFAAAFSFSGPSPRFDEADEKTIVDPIGLVGDEVQDEDDRPTTEMLHRPEVPAVGSLGTYDASDERTVVDVTSPSDERL